MAKKFKIKEEILEAVYFDGDNVDEIRDFILKNSILTTKELFDGESCTFAFHKNKKQNYSYSFKSNANLYIPYFGLPCYVYLKDNEIDFMPAEEFEKKYNYLGEISDD